MFIFIKDLFNKIKEAKTYKKVLVCFGILLWLGLLLICVIPVGYTVITPGIASKASSRIDITSEQYTKYDSGQVYTLAVYSDNTVSIFRYLLSKANKKYDVSKYDKKTDQSDYEEGVSGIIMMDLSTTKAIICAYTEASKINPQIKIAYTFDGMIIDQINHTTGDKQLKQRDLITRVNGVKIESENHFWEEFSRKNIIDNRIRITVLREDKEIELNIYLYDSENGGYKLGFYCEPYYTIDKENTYPEFHINETDTIGPSGGLLQSLSIYNQLFEEDITKGKVVVGTGTILMDFDSEGNLTFNGGSIGAITQKIVTAAYCDSKENIDVFFVDQYNYDDALEAYHQFAEGKFDLVKVCTFSDIIDYFKEVE